MKQQTKTPDTTKQEIINGKTFEQYLADHPYKETRSFTKEDWESSMYEHWKDQTPTPTEKQLHTQGEWEFEQCRGNNRYEHIIFSRNGGNNGSYVIAQLGFGKYKDEKEPEEIKANAELIVKAVNERQALLDSHRELLDALEKASDILNGYNKSSYIDSLDKKQIEIAIHNAKNI